MTLWIAAIVGYLIVMIGLGVYLLKVSSEDKSAAVFFALMWPFSILTALVLLAIAFSMKDEEKEE